LYASVNVGYGILIKNMPHPTSAPWIPDLAFSGVIDAVGSDVSNVKVGDVVFGGQNFTAHFKYGGVMTEYLVSPADFVVLKPDNVSLQHAAGLSAQGCSVVQLMEVSKIKRGDKVLITAASGGLGTLLVQACKSVVGENGTIVATCSGPNMDMVRKLGADEVSLTPCHMPSHERLFVGSRLPLDMPLHRASSNKLTDLIR
jgi:NADPH:quinone reductase-like Zn-dependent oxidoreductase